MNNLKKVSIYYAMIAISQVSGGADIPVCHF